MALNTNTVIDPLLLTQKYLKNITYPITQDNVIQLAISNNAPQEVLEQMEEMLQADSFDNSDQLFNELGGFYNDGEAVSMDN